MHSLILSSCPQSLLSKVTVLEGKASVRNNIRKLTNNYPLTARPKGQAERETRLMVVVRVSLT